MLTGLKDLGAGRRLPHQLVERIGARALLDRLERVLAPAPAASQEPTTNPDRPNGEPKGSLDDHAPKSVSAVVRDPLLKTFGQLIALSFFINLLSLAPPVFVLQVYDRVVFHAGVETLFGLVIAVVIAIAFDLILREARARIVQRIALRVDIGLARLLFEKLCRLPMSVLEKQSDVEWRGLLRDGETVRDTIAGPATVVLIDLPFVALFLLVIWIIAAPIAWLLAALIPVYLGLALVSSWVIGRSNQTEQSASDRRDALSGQMISGRATVKALSLGEALRARWEDATAELVTCSIQRGGRSDFFSNIGTSTAILTTVLLTTFGAMAIINQELTIGGLIAANMLAGKVIQPLTRLVGLWRSLSRFKQANARINDVLQQSHDSIESAVGRPRPRGVLTIENVGYLYDGADRRAVDGISLTLRPGGLHGIVGLNGSGKTTLLKLVQGLYTPESGRVLLDDADIAQFGRDDLARWIGYLPQELFLFSGTIRDNIARGRDDITDEAILLAARNAGAEAFIDALPDGFGTDVGEAGRRLSSGQRQLVALARALVDDPPILLLDEPSSNLDSRAEDELSTRLRTLCRTRCVLVVTHSTTLLSACDNIILLQGGRVAKAGNGRDVLPMLFPNRVAAQDETESSAA